MPAKSWRWCAARADTPPPQKAKAARHTASGLFHFNQNKNHSIPTLPKQYFFISFEMENLEILSRQPSKRNGLTRPNLP
ncbi:hypothetical protein [Allofranklinella schreckenbergeri]|uniref:hypothetical protein n=1 Tax=Allofranklinella schreckenbergeri TaxID=1076744 RepID=UPI0011C360CD|nr:hypothetical protein [Allofranklinella schreckenbergeri]